jgi:hypothetical protein
VEEDVREALRLARGVREIVQRAGNWPDNVPEWENLL